jgi:hypothetical protein
LSRYSTGHIKFLENFEEKVRWGRSNHIWPRRVYTLIAKFFISAEIAFKKADDPYWQKLVNYCHPDFRVGRQSVRTDVISVYEDEKHNLLENFAGLRSHISLTANLWTSNQNLG